MQGHFRLFEYESRIIFLLKQWVVELAKSLYFSEFLICLFLRGSGGRFTPGELFGSLASLDDLGKIRFDDLSQHSGPIFRRIFIVARVDDEDTLVFSALILDDRHIRHHVDHVDEIVGELRFDLRTFDHAPFIIFLFEMSHQDHVLSAVTDDFERIEQGLLEPAPSGHRRITVFLNVLAVVHRHHVSLELRHELADRIDNHGVVILRRFDELFHVSPLLDKGDVRLDTAKSEILGTVLAIAEDRLRSRRRESRFTDAAFTVEQHHERRLDLGIGSVVKFHNEIELVCRSV